MIKGINLLVDRQLRSLPDGRHNDGGYLYLVVRGASRAFVVRAPRVNGGRREIGLGSIDRITLKQARTHRDALLVQLNNGLDPIEEKRKAREAEARRKTFADVAADVMKTLGKNWRKSVVDGRESTLAQWTKDMTVVCAPIADRFVDEITVADIKALVSPFFALGHRDRALSLIGRIETVFDSAIHDELRTAANPASVKVFGKRNPKPKGEDPHHAALDWRAAPELIQRLRASDAVSARILEFAILTAARSIEARGALWSEIDFDRRIWTLPGERMKKARRHEVPLSDQAIELLRRMEAERIGAFVFPGGRGAVAQALGKPMSNSSLWMFVKRVANGADITTHGFRSTFKDWADNQGIDHRLSERALAHVGKKTERAYARENLIELRKPVMAAWGAYLGGELPRDNVVPLRAA
jgi:integrase